MSNRRFAWPIGWLGVIGILALALPGYAQNVVADGTVGTTIAGDGPFTVTGGSQQLTTLFHSFQEFSPSTADVLFQLDGTQSAVDVVIGRVTGANLSLIDGQLELTGGNNPDLFLINPNGITFGANASLLLPGSFFASTAESVLFNDELSFSSRNSNSAPLLSVSTPVGLQFGNTANEITLNQSELILNTGESLGLLGGNLQFFGSNIIVESGYTVLGGVAADSQVTIDPNTFLITYDNATDFQDILLTQGAMVDVSGDGGGRFQLQGRSITLTDDAALFAFNLGDSDGETLTIRATDKLELIGDDTFPPVVIDVSPLAAGQGNSLLIETDLLTLTNTAFIVAEAEGTGAGGDLTINADDISLLGISNEFATVIAADTFGPGQGGDLTITANQLLAQKPTLIQATTFGEGPDAGDGGDFILNVERLVLREGSQIGTGTFGGGSSGAFTITATDAVDIQGTGVVFGDLLSSGIFSSAEFESTGNAGDLSLTTPRLTITQGGKIAVNTVGSGDGGNLSIQADLIEVADAVVDASDTVSGIVASVNIDSTGNGGSLDIEADQLQISRGGQITASTEGFGAAGSINIRASEIDIAGQSDDALFHSAITSSSTTSFNAGAIRLNGDQITIRDGGQVSVSSLNEGNAGNLTISADNLVLNDGVLQAQVTAGIEGNININATQLILLRQNSEIVTSATDMAAGGNIVLVAPVILGLENSDIVANAVFGSGGNIDITTQGLFGLMFREQLTPDNDITASSKFGLSGTVAINDFNVQPDSGLVELPENLADASNQVVQGCTGGRNQFVVTGRGGVPAAPTEGVHRDRIWTDTRDLTSFLNDSQIEFSVVSTDATLEEANIWYHNDLGQVELVATNAAAVSSVSKTTCADASMDFN